MYPPIPCINSTDNSLTSLPHDSIAALNVGAPASVRWLPLIDYNDATNRLVGGREEVLGVREAICGALSVNKVSK